ncbi:hypothetical protein Vafri_1810 [Volvox africanus]|nr:hypothetical protein Vafri_1810 [Volvox africanus]
MSLSMTRSPESANKLSPNAIRRLQRDLKVWEQERGELHIPVALGFSDSNLTTLYINFKPNQGPYKDAIIHIHATFPADYPSSPPDVRMMTPGFDHPNVFENWFNENGREGAYICLDMIKSPELYARPYSGWSAAYDICGLVLQLYSFLIGDDNIDQDLGYSISRASYDRTFVRQQRSSFKCHCGFTELPDSPPSQDATQDKLLPTTTKSIPELPNDVMGLIVNKLDTCTLSKIVEDFAGSTPRRSMEFSADQPDTLTDIALQAIQNRELICFYHKTPAAGGGGGGSSVRSVGDNEDDGDVLGFGVAVVRHHDGKLKSLSMAMDLMSYRAFNGGVRRSAWNVPFDAFIPLALNIRHEGRAIQLLPGCVADMLRCSCAEVKDEQLLEVLARLMNSLVVEMVMEDPLKARGSAATTSKNMAPRHMSDAALKGFCHLHHLLLTVALTKGLGNGGEGSLVLRCQGDVLKFIADRGARHKSLCPDLGLLLIKYVLVPKDVVPWSTFAPVFVRELLARHVMWVSRALKHEGDAFLSPWQGGTAGERDLWRLETHLKHSRTSLMTVAVESFFVNALARPAGGSRGDVDVAATGGSSISPLVLNQLAGIKATYDKRNGEPPTAVFDAFSHHARSVLSMSKWTECLAALRLGLRPPPPRPDGRPATVGDMAHQMADALRQAVLDSQQSGYHTLRCAVNGVVAHAPRKYIDWEGSPPVGVVSDDWRH